MNVVRISFGILGHGRVGLRLATVGLLALLASDARAELYAHWPLDDGAGDRARNLAPQGVDGIIHDGDLGGLGESGSVWVQDPERGTVLGLAGTTAWVEAGHIPVMDLENKFSWSFWARQPPEQPSPSDDIIIGNRFSGAGTVDTVPREYIKFTPNRWEMHYDDTFGNDMAYADTDIPSNDQWIYHSVVKHGASLAYYRNGELKNSGILPAGQSSADPLPLAFGGQEGAELWVGYLSDVQLYESALTADQLQSTMAGSVLADANLYARYKLDDGNDSIIAAGTGPGAIDAEISDEFAGLGLNNSVWVDDPDRGTVLGLAGAWVYAGNIPSMDLEKDFTWTFWSKSDPEQAAPNSNIIVGNRFGQDGVDTDPLEFIKITPDRVEFHMNGAGAGDLQYGPGESGVPSNDSWIHHVGVKDGDKLYYYRDGQLANSQTLISGMSSPEELPFAMGGQYGAETWLGYLSDVRLYDHALSSAEVALLAGLIAGGDCNGDGTVDKADVECACGNREDLTEVLTAIGSLRGDADFNGEVQFPDFVILANNFGKSGTYSKGDFDCDGLVQFPDFVILANAFGQAAGSTAATVPEPSSWSLLVPGLLALRRRKLMSSR